MRSRISPALLFALSLLLAAIGVEIVRAGLSQPAALLDTTGPAKTPSNAHAPTTHAPKNIAHTGMNRRNAGMNGNHALINAVYEGINDKHECMNAGHVPKNNAHVDMLAAHERIAGRDEGTARTHLAFSKLCIGIMAFDATLPANHSAITSAELRGQFTSLKTLVDGCPTTITMEGYVASYVLSTAAASIAGMTDLSTLVISNPPTQAELQTVVDKLNELIGGLQTH